MTNMVRAYFFEQYDIASDRILRSKRPAKIEAVQQWGGKLIGKYVLVPENTFDAYGFHVDQVLGGDVKDGYPER